jgi:hypothetical protein
VRYDERVTGGVTVTWAGDPARGCAEAGVCDVTGSVTARATGSGGGESSGENDEDAALSSLFLQSGPAVARVLRGPPEAPAGACTDLVPAELEVEVDRVRGGRAMVMLVPFEGSGDVALAGRCAGPLSGDLRDALLMTTVERRRLVEGVARIDLSGTRSFSGGPFSGEIRSTLVITRRSRRVRSTSWRDEDSGPAFPGPRRLAAVRMSYRVGRPSGALFTDWIGGPEPFCHALDACGGSGTHELRVGPGGRGGSLDLFALVPAARLRPGDTAGRVLRSGRVRPESVSLYVDAPARVAAAVSRPGGAVCRDNAEASLTFTGRFGARGLVLGLGPSDQSESEVSPLRTRCPGPGAADLPDNALAAGTVSLRRLGARRLDVTLRPRGTAEPGAFVVTRRGELTLPLRLSEADLDVVTVRAP